LKLFIEGVCFYLYCTKGRGAIQRGADKWYWFVVSKTLHNGLLHMQWHNYFWTGYEVLTALDSAWPAEKVLWHVSWSNPLLKLPKYNVLRHYYQRNTCLYKRDTFCYISTSLQFSFSGTFSHLSNFLFLYYSFVDISSVGWKSIIYLLIFY